MTAASPLEQAFRRLRRLYWWSLGLALFTHLVLVGSLATVFSPERSDVPEPARVKFFARRDPTLTKPLELRKIPQPRRQLVRRQAEARSARLDQVAALAAFDTRGLVAGQGSGGALMLAPTFGDRPALAAGMEPALRVQALSESRVAEDKIDLGLEMLDVNSMDTGRYQAMVIQDAANRQNLKGFVKLANVVSVHVKNSTGGSMDLRLIGVLRDVLSSFTGLQAEFVGDLTYDDERILEIPIIFFDARIYNRTMVPNEAEIKNLAQYLLQGGFIIGPLTAEMQEGLEKHAGLVRGRDFWEARIPEDHAIFSSFFDIHGGVPAGSSPHTQNKWETHQVLIGYYLKGRLVGLQPTLGWGWENFHYPAENTRQLQMAVNVIIYALTQEGSMTQRLMQMVN
ncbi:MAG: DUF4159 domain-containing protein [Candidatus Latescibacteria bacterium]|nr:DUF4159 domain-containing protein [Candidatus Latescibacterota bacterium]